MENEEESPPPPRRSLTRRRLPDTEPRRRERDPTLVDDGRAISPKEAELARMSFSISMRRSSASSAPHTPNFIAKKAKAAPAGSRSSIQFRSSERRLSESNPESKTLDFDNLVTPTKRRTRSDDHSDHKTPSRRKNSLGPHDARSHEPRPTLSGSLSGSPEITIKTPSRHQTPVLLASSPLLMPSPLLKPSDDIASRGRNIFSATMKSSPPSSAIGDLRSVVSMDVLPVLHPKPRRASIASDVLRSPLRHSQSPPISPQPSPLHTAVRNSPTLRAATPVLRPSPSLGPSPGLHPRMSASSSKGGPSPALKPRPSRSGGSSSPRASPRLSASASPPPTFTLPRSRKSHRHSRLHDEVVQACEYLKPTKLMFKQRHEACDRISQIIFDLWDDVEIHLIGSTATKLFLPGSDIDMVVRRPEGAAALEVGDLLTLGSWLEEELGPYATSMQVITTASVPLIKMFEYATGFTFDITLNVSTGLRSTALVMSYLDEHIALKPLLLVLKRLLKVHHMNELYRGGLPSYTLALMIVSFLQFHMMDARKHLDHQKGAEPAARDADKDAKEAKETRLEDFDAFVRREEKKSRTSTKEKAEEEEDGATTPTQSVSSDAQGEDFPDHWSESDDEADLFWKYEFDMGEFLLSFLELYGKSFSYDKIGISLADGGGYFPKLSRKWVTGRQPYHHADPCLLCLENPQDTSMDLGFKSFNIGHIRSMFAATLDYLGPQQAGRRPERLWRLLQLPKPPDPRALAMMAMAHRNPGYYEMLVQKSLYEAINTGTPPVGAGHVPNPAGGSNPAPQHGKPRRRDSTARSQSSSTTSTPRLQSAAAAAAVAAGLAAPPMVPPMTLQEAQWSSRSSSSRASINEETKEAQVEAVLRDLTIRNDSSYRDSYPSLSGDAPSSSGTPAGPATTTTIASVSAPAPTPTSAPTSFAAAVAKSAANAAAPASASAPTSTTSSATASPTKDLTKKWTHVARAASAPVMTASVWPRPQPAEVKKEEGPANAWSRFNVYSLQQSSTAGRAAPPRAPATTATSTKTATRTATKSTKPSSSRSASGKPKGSGRPKTDADGKRRSGPRKPSKGNRNANRPRN